MISFEILNTLVDSGAFFVINEDMMTITVGAEDSEFIDDKSETGYHRIDGHVPLINFPLGENLFNFLAISHEDFRLIWTLVENNEHWDGSWPDGSVRDFLLGLNCIYLPLLYYSFNRPPLGGQRVSRLDRMAKEFEFALNFCCNDNFNESLRPLTALQRYYIYCQLYVDNNSTTERLYTESNHLFLEPVSRVQALDYTQRKGRKLSRADSPEELEPITDVPDLKKIASVLQNIPVHATYRYQYQDLNHYLLKELFTLIKLDLRVKKCLNCGKYFILKGDYATEYCDRILENEKFTCKKIAAIRTRKAKVNGNPILKEYQKAYKRMFARVSNKKMTHEDFRIWSEGAAEKRDQIIELYETNPSAELLQEFKDYLGNK